MAIARGLRAFLAVALLLAWTNALVHPIEHVDEAGALVHLGEQGDSRHAKDPLCDAVAAVAACVAGSGGLVFAVPLGVEAVLARQPQAYRHATLLAYRSQAPPQYS